MINLSDIDSFVNQKTQSFKSLVEIFNMKNTIEKDKMLKPEDLLRSHKESIKMIQEYSLNVQDLAGKIYQEFLNNNVMDEISLDKIKAIYEEKARLAIVENTSLLLKNSDKNSKKSQIRNVSRVNQSSVKYENGYIYDASQRKISLVDKFRKDLRKVFVDYVNDVVVFSAYKNGKKNGYTKTVSGELYKIFSLSDYIRGDVKNTIFHPNVQSLAYVED